MKFEDAIDLLEQGKMLYRKCWNGKGMFIFKQIPAEIGIDIIPKMQSVPADVKALMLKRNQSLKYSIQLAIVDSIGRVNSWSPSVDDAFAYDWEFYAE